MHQWFRVPSPPHRRCVHSLLPPALTPCPVFSLSRFPPSHLVSPVQVSLFPRLPATLPSLALTFPVRDWFTCSSFCCSERKDWWCWCLGIFEFVMAFSMLFCFLNLYLFWFACVPCGEGCKKFLDFNSDPNQLLTPLSEVRVGILSLCRGGAPNPGAYMPACSYA